jgi:predicted dinucleotide-utilizing enzyme
VNGAAPCLVVFGMHSAINHRLALAPATLLASPALQRGVHEVEAPTSMLEVKVAGVNVPLFESQVTAVLAAPLILLTGRGSLLSDSHTCRT